MTGESPYLVGIDLGTSNCAVAFAEPGPNAAVIDFPVAQLQRPGVVASQALLPSCVYTADPHEFPGEALRLPWGDSPPEMVGECARWQGARVPGRLITSAKSWLCHPGVDRQAPILPWGAPADARKLSPVDVSARLLAHMASAWDAAHPAARLADQEVVITVPASFDEVARTLTVAAARKAGLSKFTLLEEPQAAFYDFTATHKTRLAQVLEGIRLILVVDVGGGTTDLTLIEATPGQAGPSLRRLAVGEHLILGGDNMDAALGRLAESRMLSGGRKLTVAQWGQLVEASRLAKESLLGGNAPEHFNLAVGGEGSRLVGGSLSARVSRAEAEQVLLEGFFPRCGREDGPSRSSRVALQEIGLPYASDPAITRQIAGYLKLHSAAGRAALEAGGAPSGASIPRPDAILLNGGVFKSDKLAARLVEVISSWWPEAPPIPTLTHGSLDLAVARGAAYYGLVRRGQGKRISGGAAHALYVGLEKRGSPAPMALCVIPRGQEEGEPVDLGAQKFRLAVGKPVQFPLFSSASDRVEKAGDITPVSEDMTPLPAIHTILKAAGKQLALLPVHLSARLTEIGTLELWCVSEAGQERWRLEFELRGGSGPETTTVTESMPAGFREARTLLESVFSAKGQPPPGGEGNVKQLWNRLERTLGGRESWRVPVLRELWGVLYAGAGKRRKSAEHERIFYQLLGYTLRPGFGYPLDPWRCEQAMKLLPAAVHFAREKPVWNEFWVLWRRISGGLNEEQQSLIWDVIKGHVAARLPLPGRAPEPKPKGSNAEGAEEMIRLAAALERLPIAEKIELGTRIAARLRTGEKGGGLLTWALGRVGARVPLTGSSHQTVPPEIAGQWALFLLDDEVRRVEGALFALTQLARRSGDRARDLDDHLRADVLAALEAAKAPASWLRLVSEVQDLEAEDQARALGDTLPAGLQAH